MIQMKIFLTQLIILVVTHLLLNPSFPVLDWITDKFKIEYDKLIGYNAMIQIVLIVINALIGIWLR